MPQIIFRDVARANIASFRRQLVNELSEIIACPRDHFIIEHRQADYVGDYGNHCHYGPLVQVYWFDRGKEIRQKVATVVDKAVRGCGYSSCEVYFIDLQREFYYENGVSFA